MDNKTQTDFFLKQLKEYSSETYNHSIRVANLAEELYGFTGLPKEHKEDVITGALLHDVGKLKVPIYVLKKQGRLTEEEMKIIISHPTEGFKMLKDFPEIVKNICLLHHKKIDGSGYPAEDIFIPDYVQFITVLDIFDALSSKRCYKEIIANMSVMEILRKEAHIGVLSSEYVNLISYVPYAHDLLR